MFHMPMSSPMMTTMFGLPAVASAEEGFFACAKMLLAENIAINPTATASIDVNGGLTGFMESYFVRDAVSAIWDFSPTDLRFSCPGPSRNENRDDSCQC